MQGQWLVSEGEGRLWLTISLLCFEVCFNGQRSSFSLLDSSIPSLICLAFQFCFLSWQILELYLYPSFWSENLPTHLLGFSTSILEFLLCLFPGYFLWHDLQNLLFLPVDPSSSSCFSVPNAWLIQAWSWTLGSYSVLPPCSTGSYFPFILYRWSQLPPKTHLARNALHLGLFL